MNLARWTKRNRGNGREAELAITRFRSEMDRMFDRFTQEPFGFMEPYFAPMTQWSPALDISETDSEITIRAEVPGMEASDIDVSVSDNWLTICGEKKEETEREGEDYYHCERRFGSFKRSLELPAKIDANKLVADYDKGVLTVRVPKPETAKARHIDVKPTAESKPSRRVPVGAA